jgi:hypothetical protein
MPSSPFFIQDQLLTHSPAVPGLVSFHVEKKQGNEGTLGMSSVKHVPNVIALLPFPGRRLFCPHLAFTGVKTLTVNDQGRLSIVHRYYQGGRQLDSHAGSATIIHL